MTIDKINSFLTDKTDYIVENGKKCFLTFEQLLALQVLVKNREIDTNDFQLFDSDGNQLTIRNDGKLKENSTAGKIVDSLIYELM